MMDLLLAVILLASVASFAVATLAFRSSRRSENLGENRYELLRDQHDRLETLREERHMLTEQLEREYLERRQLTEYLAETDPRLMENLERRRQARAEGAQEGHLEEERLRLQHEHQRLTEELEQERGRRLEVQEWAEQLQHEEQSRAQRDVGRLEQEHRRLMEDLETEREQRLATQQQAERLEEEWRLLQQEHRRVMEELEQERLGHQEISQRAEGLEREQAEVLGVQQEAERLRQERQRLAEDLEREREERARVQGQTEQQAQELARLEQELRRSQVEPDRRKRASARGGGAQSGTGLPWWRRPLLAVGLLLGVLIAWFTSLVVALNLLAS